jgi:NAD-dependent dihydropyrimidine dehydrogenase PreA subunit
MLNGSTRGLIAGIILAAAVPEVPALGWIYQVDPSICNGCGVCIPHCPTGALRMEGPDAVIDPELCNTCGLCLPYCALHAIFKCWWEDIEEGIPPSVQGTVGPNPTPGPVLLAGGVPGAWVTAADLSGRVVRTCRADTEGCAALDLQGLPAGLYVVSCGEQTVGSVLLLGRSE